MVRAIIRLHSAKAANMNTIGACTNVFLTRSEQTGCLSFLRDKHDFTYNLILAKYLDDNVKFQQCLDMLCTFEYHWSLPDSALHRVVLSEFLTYFCSKSPLSHHARFTSLFKRYSKLADKTKYEVKKLSKLAKGAYSPLDEARYLAKIDALKENLNKKAEDSLYLNICPRCRGVGIVSGINICDTCNGLGRLNFEHDLILKWLRKNKFKLDDDIKNRIEFLFFEVINDLSSRIDSMHSAYKNQLNKEHNENRA